MSTKKLEEQLALAEQQVVRGEGSLRQRTAAHDALAAAQRVLAAARGLDYAVPLEVGCLPGAALSGPLLIQSDLGACLTFNAVCVGPDGLHRPAGTAVVEIERCQVTQFGYPNDEALPGHPLYRRGLSGYGICRVCNSSWIGELTARNCVAFPQTPDSEQTHFILCFHDSSFECIGSALRVSLSNQPYEQIFASISRRVFGGEAPRWL